MKRVLPAIFLVACGSFESAPSAEADAGESTTRTTKTDGGSAEAGVDAAESCTLIVDEPFDGRDLSSAWVRVVPVQNSVFAAGLKDVAGGPSPITVLGTTTQTQPNGGALDAYVHRMDARTNVRSLSVDYDLAYGAPPQAHARVGCTPGLHRADGLEARVSIEATGPGLVALGTLETQGEDVPGSKATSAIDTPPVKTWTHVRVEIALSTDGSVERALTLGGTRTRLPAFVPPMPLKFDSVHLLCGVENAFAETNSTANAAVFMKGLRVTACGR